MRELVFRIIRHAEGPWQNERTYGTFAEFPNESVLEKVENLFHFPGFWF